MAGFFYPKRKGALSISGAPRSWFDSHAANGPEEFSGGIEFAVSGRRAGWVNRHMGSRWWIIPALERVTSETLASSGLDDERVLMGGC